MLGPLSKHTFKFVRSNGTCVKFNIDTLVDYFLATGDFTDPETRIPFSDNDLKNIDELVIFRVIIIFQLIPPLQVKRAGMVKPSAFEAKMNPQQFAESKFRADALQGIFIINI